MKALGLFDEVSTRPAAEWPVLFPGRRAVGVFGAYVPEEIIIAAGFVPIHLSESAGGPADQAYLPRFCCAPVRALLARGISGELAWLEALAFGAGCDSCQALADIWRRLVAAPRALNVKAPVALASPAAKAYLLEELRSFADELGLIGDDSLREAIKHTNETRSLFSRFETAVGRLAPRRLHSVLSAAHRMPRAEFNRAFAELLAAFETSRKHDGPRLILAGPHLGDAGLYAAIEDAGGCVAGDMLDLGEPFFSGFIAGGGDPFEALAHHMLGRLPTPTKFSPNDVRAAALIARFKRAAAQGVLLAGQPFCDPHGFEAAALKRSLFREDIPCLIVEADGQARMRTRVEAFLEMIAR